MKRLYTLIFFIFSAAFVQARPASDTNIMIGAKLKSSAAMISNINDQNKQSVVVFAKELDKVIEVEFKPTYYLKKMRLFFKPGRVPYKLNIEKKIDRTGQYQLQRQINVRGKLQDKVFVVDVDLNKIAANFLRISFPESNEREIVISEIEIFPEMNSWPEGIVTSPEIVTDREVYLEFSGNQEMKGVFEVKGHNKTVKVPSIHSGKQHQLWLHGLEPQTTYTVKVKMLGYHGNINSSKEITFRTRKENIALNKLVKGSFNQFQPDDKFVLKKSKRPIQQINDGDDSYFTSMATSGDPEKQEQFFIIDLEKRVKLTDLVIIWRSLAYSKEYIVELSLDSKRWERVAVHQDASQGVFGYSRTGDPVRIMSHSLENRSGRYLKITVPKGSPYYVADPTWKFVQIMDVKIF